MLLQVLSSPAPALTVFIDAERLEPLPPFSKVSRTALVLLLPPMLSYPVRSPTLIFASA